MPAAETAPKASLCPDCRSPLDADGRCQKRGCYNSEICLNCGGKKQKGVHICIVCDLRIRNAMLCN